jgi:hypothetical protein
MAEILVSNLCARRLSLAGFSLPPVIARMTSRRIPRGGGSRSAVALPFAFHRTSALARIFRPFRMLCALFFPLFSIVPELAAFLKLAQSLAL